MLFLSAMEIGKDPVHLTASNYREMDHRNWRTSLLVPFATNFVAVFYRYDLNISLISGLFLLLELSWTLIVSSFSCDSSESPFKVAFYLAENPLTLNGCNNGVCDWAQLRKKLGAVAANCSAEVCRKAS